MSSLDDKKLAIMNERQWRLLVGENSVGVKEQVDRSQMHSWPKNISLR